MTVRSTSIISGISTPQSLTAVYLNESNLEYELSFAKNESLLSFYIVHSRLKVEALFTIFSKLYKKCLFILATLSLKKTLRIFCHFIRIIHLC